MIKHIAIFDCDGVLLDSSHRYRVKDNGKINLEHWRTHSVESEIWKDEPLPMSTVYARMVRNPSVYVILATARQMTRHDFESIEQKIGLPNKLVYRKKGDTRGGTDLKLAGIRPLLNLRNFRNAAITVFEDNIDYLRGLTTALNAHPVYVHSKQGF